MLIDTYLSTCLYAALAGAGLLLLGYLYRDYRIDRMRDELFEVRDQLFDYAVEEALLDHAGYRRLRDTFNGMLRFCHKISFFRLCVSMALEILLVPQNQRKNPYTEWLKIVEDLPQAQKDKLIHFHFCMFVIAMQYLTKTSVILGPVLSLLQVKDLFRHAGASVLPKLINRTERGWQIIEEQALESAS
jgi:hypothetical protein